MNLDKKILQMLNHYKNSHLSLRQSLREILQQCARLGLARNQFFEHAAFYGGTALRILYGLDRFSEDLDFSLLRPNKKFEINPFLKGLERELLSMGFDVDVSSKKKKNKSDIISAFIKGNTKIILLSLTNRFEKNLHKDEKIKIKFEIDVDPPPDFEVESKLILNPVPFYVLTYKTSYLFAGKVHAMLCRTWQNRVKGRDWYDFIWYLQNKIPLHLKHLEKRIKQSGHFEKKERLTEKKLIKLLQQKIEKIDWKNAKEDIKPFIYDVNILKLWNKDFFLDLLQKITII